VVEVIGDIGGVERLRRIASTDANGAGATGTDGDGDGTGGEADS
jgi:hypothetical protein